MDPAIKGTINVLTVAKEAGVRRVVVTSSISAMIPNPNWPANVVRNEESWTDVDYCKQRGVSALFGLNLYLSLRTITIVIGSPRILEKVEG